MDDQQTDDQKNGEPAAPEQPAAEQRGSEGLNPWSLLAVLAVFAVGVVLIINWHWRRGSVVTSWLLDLSAIALAKDPRLEAFSGHVADSGEGRWTVAAAIEEAVPAEVLTAALFTRFRSRQEHNFAEKLLSAMRLGFGGHKEQS